MVTHHSLSPAEMNLTPQRCTIERGFASVRREMPVQQEATK
jgi:hypothetical protein